MIKNITGKQQFAQFIIGKRLIFLNLFFLLFSFSSLDANYTNKNKKYFILNKTKIESVNDLSDWECSYILNLFCYGKKYLSINSNNFKKLTVKKSLKYNIDEYKDINTIIKESKKLLLAGDKINAKSKLLNYFNKKIVIPLNEEQTYYVLKLYILYNNFYISKNYELSTWIENYFFPELSDPIFHDNKDILIYDKIMSITNIKTNIIHEK